MSGLRVETSVDVGYALMRPGAALSAAAILPPNALGQDPRQSMACMQAFTR